MPHELRQTSSLSHAASDGKRAGIDKLHQQSLNKAESPVAIKRTSRL